MISILIILLFFTFYIFYVTTKRINIVSNLRFEKNIQAHPSLAKKIGLMLMLISFIISIDQLGFCVGILFNVIGFMTIGGLIVLLTPLQLITYKNICIAFVLCFLIEWFQQITSI
ncbi:hypothetical protein QVZ41_08940 [Wenyingzhuangia sp. chi5]|uniref:DoxX-like protein n=1 Tax=Wenyingzhuangia gilva TaxID=3057677 RepID=A0ABT8VSM2_9FLAO|nr:hypothetical protein [Wenyingzhuangia sp. chi5]MDO3694966.1 hypothetical protein [Wenyingzhuangia sp. chi5]